jgi:hypothetical protein
MGMYFNSADTMKLCGKLNMRFSEQNLDQIRQDPDRLAKFNDPQNNRRTLARIAYKSGTWPTKKSTNNKALRWFKFLKDLQDNNAAVAKSIKQALYDGLTTKANGVYKYKSLIFTAIEGTVVKFSPMDIKVLDANNGTVGLSLLFVLQTAAVGAGTYDPATAPDTGEDYNQEPNDDDNSGVDPSTAVVVRSGKPTRTAPAKKAAKKKKR